MRILDIDNQPPNKEQLDKILSTVCKNCGKKKGINSITFYELPDGRVIWWHKNWLETNFL